ncbi:MAG TPA: molybdenum cofactor guanylyltransferase [Candidatus Limnocylindrales bacterium]
MTGPAASGIVLAGGRSSRFGRDKLAEPIEGRPLLHRAIAAVAGVCTETLVVVTPVEAPPPLPAGLAVHVVRDPEPFGGPLVGLFAGLEQAREPLALVVAGDMPDLQPGVLRALVHALDDEDVAGAVLRYRGRDQPLPMAVRNGIAATRARDLLARGERSLAALVSAVRARALEESDWRGVDPTAATLHDIDRPSDLDRYR